MNANELPRLDREHCAPVEGAVDSILDFINAVCEADPENSDRWDTICSVIAFHLLSDLQTYLGPANATFLLDMIQRTLDDPETQTDPVLRAPAMDPIDGERALRRAH